MPSMTAPQQKKAMAMTRPVWKRCSKRLAGSEISLGLTVNWAERTGTEKQAKVFRSARSRCIGIQDTHNTC